MFFYVETVFGSFVFPIVGYHAGYTYIGKMIGEETVPPDRLVGNGEEGGHTREMVFPGGALLLNVSFGSRRFRVVHTSYIVVGREKRVRLKRAPEPSTHARIVSVVKIHPAGERCAGWNSSKSELAPFGLSNYTPLFREM